MNLKVMKANKGWKIKNITSGRLYSTTYRSQANAKQKMKIIELWFS